MTTANLVFGNYVTSATFCLKLGKKEIETLGHLFNGLKVRDGTDASLWSLASKGFMLIRLRPTHTSRCTYAIYPVVSHNVPCHINGVGGWSAE